MIIELGAGQRRLLRLGRLTRRRGGTKQIHLRFVGLQPRLQLIQKIGGFRTHALEAIAKLIEFRVAQTRTAEFFLQQIQLSLPVGGRGRQINSQFLVDTFGHFRRIDPRIGRLRRGFAVTGIAGASCALRRRRRSTLRQGARRARQQGQGHGG